MKIAIIALATSFALPAYAGSLAVPVEEPSVAVAMPMAVAAPTRSYYGALSVIGAMPDATFTQLDSAFPAQDGDLSLDNAVGLSAVLGHDYGTGLRVELEFMRFGGDTGTLSFPTAEVFQNNATDGTYRMTGGMLNTWYTFGKGAIRPFVGGGIGVMHTNVDTDFTIASNDVNVAGKDTVFAWQIGAGAEIPVTDSLSILATYRYLEANGFDLVDSNDHRIKADLQSNVFTVGAMFRF